MSLGSVPAAAATRAVGQSPPSIVVPPPGPRSRQLAKRLAAVESPAVDARRESRANHSHFEQTPIVFARAEGANVVDVDGNCFVDLAAGFGALPLGHRPRAVQAALEAQSAKLWLALGDVYPSDVKVALSERLAALYPDAGARVLLGSSGSDAITAALKTALLATGKARVVAFEGAYHGLSYAPLAACGLHAAFREPFASQLGEHVTFVPYPHDEVGVGQAIFWTERAMSTGEVGAVLVEPLLGRGGCVVPPPSFLPALRRACDRSGALLVCDEVWTGLGRSGAWLASVEAGVVPDVVCLGKALGSGLPISACVGSERAMRAWGEHGGTTIHTGTHFGAPLAAAAALATLEEIAVRSLPARSYAAGERWRARLREATAGRGVVEVRGRGLMVGVALEGGAARALAVTRRLLEEGWIVLTGAPRGDVLTLTPPLDIDEALLDAFSTALAETLEAPLGEA